MHYKFKVTFKVNGKYFSYTVKDCENIPSAIWRACNATGAGEADAVRVNRQGRGQPPKQY